MMRKTVWVLALLLCCWFSLSAQSRNAVSIFIPVVTGTGGSQGDNSFFFRQLITEVSKQGFTMAKTQNNADYSLAGTLSPQVGQSREIQYVFHLALRDNKTGQVTVEQDLIYRNADDTNQLFPVLVSNLLHTIPRNSGNTGYTGSSSSAGISDEWRNKRLYFGLAVFWTPRVYIGSDSGNSSTYYGNVRGAFSTELQFANFMSLETGAELTADWIVTDGKPDGYQNTIIEIPFMLKFVIKPGVYFMLEPYGGAQYNLPIYDTTKPAMFSWLAGIQYGVKAGPGALFIDARFAMDIGESAVEEPPGQYMAFQRYIIHLGLGYKYGVSRK
jgi:hypothetical protein